MKKIYFLFLLFFLASIITSQAQTGAWVQVGESNAKSSIAYILPDKINSEYIYAAGGFKGVAKWDGSSWTQLGGTIGRTFEHISVLTQDNSGNLFAAGTITDTFMVKQPYPYNLCYVAKWDGTNWSKLGSGTNVFSTSGQEIHALATDQFGNVYAAGNAYDNNGNYFVKKWNGSVWSQLGNTNLTSSQISGEGISSMQVGSDGRVYITGFFNIDATRNQAIYMWDGSTWTQLGTAESYSWNNTSIILKSGNPVASLHDGISIYSGSTWNKLGDLTTNAPLAIDKANNIYAFNYQIKKFNGSSWSNLGSRIFQQVFSIAADNLGNVYTTAVNTKRNNFYQIVKWDPAAIEAPVVAENISYCKNSAAMPLTATGTDLKWYTSFSGGVALASAPTPSTVVAGNTSYYVSQTINGVESQRMSIVVTITETATPIAVSSISYCTNETAISLQATGSNLKWYTDAIGVAASTTSPVPSTSSSGVQQYYVSQTINSCESDRILISVNVSSTTLPEAPTVSTPINYCLNATSRNLAATGANVKWYNVPTGGIGYTTYLPTTNTSGTQNYYVTQTNNGCESLRALVQVEVSTRTQTPVPIVSSPLSYCQNETAASLTASGNSLNWYSQTGGNPSSTAPIPSTSITGSKYYYVTQTIDGCESAMTNIAVNVLTVPNAPVVSSPVYYCQNETATFLSASGISLKWYTSVTGGTATTATPIPVITNSDTLDYYVSQKAANGCESSRSLITVYVRALNGVTITSGTNLFICNNGGNITISSNAGTSYLWINGNDIVGTNQTYNILTPGNYKVILTELSGCKDTSDVITVSTSNLNCYDCAGILNGTATLDNCTICSGGTTGLTACTATAMEYRSSSAKTISSHPQPFNNSTTIKLKNEKKIKSILIINSMGEMIEKISDLDLNQIEIGENLNAGFYTLIIESNEETYTGKIIKLK